MDRNLPAASLCTSLMESAGLSGPRHKRPVGAHMPCFAKHSVKAVACAVAIWMGFGLFAQLYRVSNNQPGEFRTNMHQSHDRPSLHWRALKIQPCCPNFKMSISSGFSCKGVSTHVSSEAGSQWVINPHLQGKQNWTCSNVGMSIQLTSASGTTHMPGTCFACGTVPARVHPNPSNGEASQTPSSHAMQAISS